MYLLLNISESRNSEIKMLKKGLISTLLELLQRDNFELLIICISFLKKLSVFAENVDQMFKLDIISRVDKVTFSSNENYKKISYRFLLNLSFHVLVETDMLKILKNLSCGLFANSDDVILLSIMYNISVQEVSLFYSLIDNVLPLFKQWLQALCLKGLDSRLLALLINLQHSKQISQFFLDSSTLSIILRNSLCDNVQGAVLLKFVAIGMCHKTLCEVFLAEHFVQLLEYLPLCENEDQLVEIIRIFSYLSPSQLQYLCTSPIFNINLYLLAKFRSYTDLEDDLLLEFIICTGYIFLCKEISNFWLETNIFEIFLKILIAKEEDDEIVLQVTFIFYILFFTISDSKGYLSKISSYLIDLVSDKNHLIASLSDDVLNIVFHSDPISAKQLIQSRFDVYNYHWIESLMDMDE